MNLARVLLANVGYISKKMAIALEKRNIVTVLDLLCFFPIRYESRVLSNDLFSDDFISGIVLSLPVQKKHRDNLSSLSFSMQVNNKNINVIIFNRNYLLNTLHIGDEIFIQGKYDKKQNMFVASTIKNKLNEGIESIYPSIDITPYYLKKIINKTIELYSIYITETLPQPLLDKYHLISFSHLVIKAHNPKNSDDIKEVSRRNKYEEFLRFELLIMAYQRVNRKSLKKPIEYDIHAVKSFINQIPFELTGDQKNAVNDIFRDMRNNYPANRLIQGDVGSGKTIVAGISLYAICTAHHQAAFMAPTEILANQHYLSLCQMFRNVNVNIEILTSSIKGKKREEIIKKLANGEIDILVGTHALLTDSIVFKDLRLVITDEQHRFGVNQRAILRKKGNNPDVIYLTATPIPRTLAICAFGDMDISSIKSMPNGRKKIITKVINNEREDLVLDFINDELNKGHQAYIIAPLIEASETLDIENVTDLYKRVDVRFKGQCALLHGKMNPKEKDEIMDNFKHGITKVLVSTTVIEVGVDVKNATVIAIYGAMRFGLSQIHQLRGRVGRNDLQSYCFLLSNKTETERLKILERVADGFVLSEEDLKLRGPGDFFGFRQSGAPIFKYGDFQKDYNVLSCALNDAGHIINNELYNREDYRCIYDFLNSYEFIKKGILD